MMLSALLNEEWLMHSYPFSSFADMESEIAELRTLTKVTKLRQQIECRQEGAWLMVRNVPDDKAKSGTRKVTTYGHSSKSLTRSYSQNVTGNSVFNDNNNSNVIIEHPVDIKPEEEKLPASNSSVEIVDVSDEPNLKTLDAVLPSSQQQPQNSAKKTSVVTLGKGNLVLIDDEDSNFQVTGISKGRVAEAVNTLERVAQGEKKVKKVGFCKTEVHFAPDSGRVRIVETDEKPPPTQIIRKKKRPRVKSNRSELPKLYFGNTPSSSSSCDDVKDTSLTDDSKVSFPILREPSPLLTISTTANVSNRNSEQEDNYGYIKKIPTKIESNKTVKKDEKTSLSYLGNVSPKLSKLLQNNMQHEFQAKQKQIMKNLEPTLSADDDKQTNTNEVNINVDFDTITEKPLKIVTQVSLGAGRGEIEHKFVVKSGNKTSEPIYVNRDVTVEIKNESNNSNNKASNNCVKEKTPKPRPRTTLVLSPQVKDVKTIKSIKQPEKVTRKVLPKPRENNKKDINQYKPVPKQCSRSPSIKSEKRLVKTDSTTNSSSSVKLQKSVKTNPNAQDKPLEPRVRKSREPLRSFEKVSNGWVGHCITPVKISAQPKVTQITVTTTQSADKTKTAAAVHSVQSQGAKRSTTTSSVTSKSSKNEINTTNKSTLNENKQFSLSKEHLRSAKLVKELATKDKQSGIIADSRISTRKHYSSCSSTTTTTSVTKDVNSSIINNRAQPRVGVVRPRIVQHGQFNNNNNNSKNKTITSAPVRIGSISRSAEQQSIVRPRRDSEQSDDSVIRADEEVRAYMFNTRHK
ncbi:hypothetical protein O3M35_001343 [Rhynocoris fuscipes]|uniref:Uncharacterized protein n=1 Tax=Rhynocoris fuscipes TaxID=488301 RepID=A0AAW1DUB9_9HEMI